VATVMIDTPIAFMPEALIVTENSDYSKEISLYLYLIGTIAKILNNYILLDLFIILIIPP